MYIYISGSITQSAQYSGSQTFLLLPLLLIHLCLSAFNRDRTKHPGVTSRESSSPPSSPLALLSPVSRNAGTEKAAQRGAEEAHHDAPGLELGEGGCCCVPPPLRDLGVGRVTEPWCKAALGKGLESKDQAVGSSDGHCHGQNSCWGGKCTLRENHTALHQSKRALGCPHRKRSAVQVWTRHPFHADTLSLPCCRPHARWRVCSTRCWLEPDGKFGSKSSRGGGWCQPVASLGGCETDCGTVTAAGCVFFTEKPAGHRSSPSSRTSPGTVLQEVSLADVVSRRRQPDVFRPSPHHCGHLNWIERGRLG